MHAASDQRVEERGQRPDEGLALAGALLGDRPAVEHDAAHHLNVVVALAQRADHRLADRREGLRQDLVEGLVDLLELALALLLQLIGEPRGIGAGKRRLAGVLVRIGLAQLDRRQDVADLVAQARAQLIGLRCELGIRESLDLGLERVDAIDDRLERSDFPLVGVPQAGQELEHREGEYRPMRSQPL